ncbi:MAG: DEAD/DEAH box helicase [Metallosphaera sp.]
MPSKIFYVKPFSDETLKKLITFSRYLGEDERGAKLMLDEDRARANGVELNEILSTLKELNVKLDQDVLSYLENELSAPNVTFEIEKGKLIVRANRRLSDILAKYRIKLQYDPDLKIYRTRPYYYHILRKILENEGLRVQKLVLPDVRFSMKLKVNLRQYQLEALEAWKENGFRGVIALPTGAGKTLVGIAGIVETGGPALIVSFTNEQLKQWEESIAKYTSNQPKIGLYYSRRKDIEPITITTYQTAIKHIDKLSMFKLLIIDEAHHLPAERFREIALSCLAPFRMGLSATPYRTDGKHVELFRLMGGLVYQKGVEELVVEGYLARFKVIRVKIPLTEEEAEQYNTLAKKFRSLSEGKRVLEVLRRAREGDRKALEAVRVYNAMNMIKGLTKGKLVKIKEIVERERDKKIIIFTQYVEHANEIARLTGAKLLTGQMSKKERDLTLDEFKNQKSGVLVLTTVGDEGLDIPDASVGILVAGTSSRRQYVQRLGRLLRNNSGGKVAVLYELIAKGTSEEYQSKVRRSTPFDSLIYSFDDKK